MRLDLLFEDALEKEQPLDIAARDYLRALISKGDGSVVVVPVEAAQYGRTVAELFVQPRPGQGYQSDEEISINAQVVVDGYTYLMPSTAIVA